jgi:hypothetical protein
MALWATHIRFAIDLQNRFGIKEINKYISGTVYPDSRYISGLDRSLLHNDSLLEPGFANDDFKKGWQVHLICDKIQLLGQKKIFFDMPSIHRSRAGFSQAWIDATALKWLQDMDDMQRFDIQPYLKFLKTAYNPNGEDIKDIIKFNQIIIELYLNKSKINSNDAYITGIKLGIGKDIMKKVKEKLEKYLKDIDIARKSRLMYGEMLEYYKNHYPATI